MYPVLMALRALLELRDHRVFKVRRAVLVPLAFKGHKALQEPLVFRVPQDQLGLLARKVLRVLRVSKGLLVLRVVQVCKDPPERRVLPDRKVLPDQQAYKVIRVQQEPLAYRVFRV